VDTLKLKSELEKVKDENTKLRKELENYRREVPCGVASWRTSSRRTARIDPTYPSVSPTHLNNPS